MKALSDLIQSSFLAGYGVVCLMNILFILLVRLAFIKVKVPFTHFVFLFGLSLGFSVLGLTIGLLVGDSREPAVNTTISASLTFLGAMVVYLFAKKDSNLMNFSKQLNNGFFVVIIALISFPTTLLYGALLGSNNRLTVEEYQQEMEIDKANRLKYYEYQLKVYEDSVQANLAVHRDSIARKK